MNGHKEEKLPYCYLHPKEAVVGICPLCLNQRLLVLASSLKKHKSLSSTIANNHKAQDFTQKKASCNFPKFFSFSSSLLKRSESRNSRSDYPDDDHDSFISIKFEENGSASWDKGKVSKVTLESCRFSWNHQIVTKELPKETVKNPVENPKPRSVMRWHKRIGRVIQLIRLKRSSPSNVSLKVDGTKVRDEGWTAQIKKRET